MIKITAIHHEDGYMKVEANGHTDPIICSAVSAIIQTAVLGLNEIAKQYPDKVKLEYSYSKLKEIRHHD